MFELSNLQFPILQKPILKPNSGFELAGFEDVVKPPKDEARLDQTGLADGSDIVALVVPEDETKNYMPLGFFRV